MGRLLFALFFVVAMLWGSLVYCQPSTSTQMQFRLFDKNGRVKPNRLFSDYQFFNYYGQKIDSGRGLSYDGKSGNYYVYLGAIYPPFIFQVVHEKDTMTLVIPQNYLRFPRLKFKAGGYNFCSIKFPRWQDRKTRFGYYVPVYRKVKHKHMTHAKNAFAELHKSGDNSSPR